MFAQKPGNHVLVKDGKFAMATWEDPTSAVSFSELVLDKMPGKVVEALLKLAEFHERILLYHVFLESGGEYLDFKEQNEADMTRIYLGNSKQDPTGQAVQLKVAQLQM